MNFFFWRENLELFICIYQKYIDRWKIRIGGYAKGCILDRSVWTIWVDIIDSVLTITSFDFE